MQNHADWFVLADEYADEMEHEFSDNVKEFYINDGNERAKLAIKQLDGLRRRFEKYVRG